MVKVEDFKGSISDGFALIKEKGKWGFIDIKENNITEAIYDNAYDFSEGLAAVNIGYKEKKKTIFSLNHIQSQSNSYSDSNLGKWGFIDAKGKAIIPLIYDEVESFENGLAIVKLNIQYGCIKKLGDTIIPIEFNEIIKLPNALYAVRNNSKWGILNHGNQVILPIEYDNIRALDQISIAVLKDNHYGAFNSEGKQVLPFIYHNIFHFYEGMAKVKLNGK